MASCSVCGKQTSGSSTKSHGNQNYCARCWQLRSQAPVGEKAGMGLEDRVSRPALHSSNREPFQMLEVFGRVLTWIGWAVVVFGILFGLFGYSSLLMGLGIAVQGILIAVVGQSVVCFVAIERNTRRTAELLGAEGHSTAHGATGRLSPEEA